MKKKHEDNYRGRVGMSIIALRALALLKALTIWASLNPDTIDSACARACHGQVGGV
jgi:hypothetical protein